MKFWQIGIALLSLWLGWNVYNEIDAVLLPSMDSPFYYAGTVVATVALGIAPLVLTKKYLARKYRGTDELKGLRNIVIGFSVVGFGATLILTNVVTRFL